MPTTLAKRKNAIKVLRRCQRNWNTNIEVPKEHVDHFISLIQKAPFIGNESLIGVYVVKDRDVIHRLYKESWGHMRGPNAVSRNTQVNGSLLFVFTLKRPTIEPSQFDNWKNTNLKTHEFNEHCHQNIGMIAGTLGYNAALLGYKTGYNRCVHLAPGQREFWNKTIGITPEMTRETGEEVHLALAIGYPDDDLNYNDAVDTTILVNLVTKEKNRYQVDVINYKSQRTDPKDILINIIK